jgi:hypothetical protein
MALNNDTAGDTWTLQIIEAAFLPKIICLHRAGPASDAATTTDRTRSATSQQAGEVPDMLVIGSTPLPQVLNAPGVVPSMIGALRDRPDFIGRFAAAHVLTIVGEGRPAQRRAMAEAGVIGLLLELFIEVGNKFWDIEETESGWNLARMLLILEPIAARDLRQAMCGPRVDLAFKALVFLQVRHSCSLTQSLGSAISLCKSSKEKQRAACNATSLGSRIVAIEE